jgi:AcrR family transcriptional regulator
MKVVSGQSRNNRKNTRQSIVDTARALFSESSYLGVSMSDIAEKLNITKAALYYHFASKEEIYNEVLDEVFRDINAAITEAFKERALDRRLYKVIRNYLDLGLKEGNIVKATLLSGKTTVKDHVLQNRKQLDGMIQPLFEEILTKNRSSGQTDARLLTSMLIFMMDGILMECSLSHHKFDTDGVAKQWVAFLFREAKGAKGRQK